MIWGWTGFLLKLPLYSELTGPFSGMFQLIYRRIFPSLFQSYKMLPVLWKVLGERPLVINPHIFWQHLTLVVYYAWFMSLEPLMCHSSIDGDRFITTVYIVFDTIPLFWAPFLFPTFCGTWYFTFLILSGVQLGWLTCFLLLSPSESTFYPLFSQLPLLFLCLPT